jgi:hypothetical protein
MPGVLRPSLGRNTPAFRLRVPTSRGSRRNGTRLDPGVARISEDLLQSPIPGDSGVHNLVSVPEQMTGMNRKHGLMTVTAMLVLAASVGCGSRKLPELAPVTGKVTLDGDPLPQLRVSFYPQSGGRPGTGVTDVEGKYELVYTAGEKGTKLGPSRVEVTMEWPDGEPMPGFEDPVPPSYTGMNSTLSFDVKPENNVYNIEMSSSGAK